jgi:hypothetical protein
MTLAAASTGLGTTAGFFLIACLVIAAILIGFQGVISRDLARSGKVDPAQLREVAERLQKASDALAKVAADNEEVSEALRKAARPAAGARRQGLRTVQGFRNGTPGLDGTIDLPLIEDLEAELEAFDPQELVERVPVERAKAVSASAREIRKETDDAAKEVEKSGQTTFFGLIGQITRQHPFIGAALLFVMLGALGADLINFSVS